jgi:hypothetical protein
MGTFTSRQGMSQARVSRMSGGGVRHVQDSMQEVVSQVTRARQDARRKYVCRVLHEEGFELNTASREHLIEVLCCAKML